MSLYAVVATELAPYDRGEGNVVVTGPDVALTPKAGLSLAMAVHELASNAAKYGALSTVAGRVTAAWKVTGGVGGRTLTLAWTGGRRPGGAAAPTPQIRDDADRADPDLRVGGRREPGVPRVRPAVRHRDPADEEVGQVRPGGEAGEDAR
jgi:anti-sigma regulatory factor (Ser/Thr protein kinase)